MSRYRFLNQMSFGQRTFDRHTFGKHTQSILRSLWNECLLVRKHLTDRHLANMQSLDIGFSTKCLYAKKHLTSRHLVNMQSLEIVLSSKCLSAKNIWPTDIWSKHGAYKEAFKANVFWPIKHLTNWHLVDTEGIRKACRPNHCRSIVFSDNWFSAKSRGPSHCLTLGFVP